MLTFIQAHVDWFVAGWLTLLFGGVVVWQVRAAILRGREAAEGWTALPDGDLFSRCLVRGPGAFDTGRVAAALQAALEALVAYGHWKREAAAVFARDVRVIVMAEETWTNWAGQKVGGETGLDGKVLYVGPSLSALCHEAAHLLEYYADSRVDYGHVGWQANGAWVADTAYRKWLAATGTSK